MNTEETNDKPPESEATTVEGEKAVERKQDESQEEDNTDQNSNNSTIISKAKTVVIATALGVGGYASTILWATPFLELLKHPAIPYTLSGNMLINYLAVAFGAVTFGALYFYFSDKDMDYIDIHAPENRQLVYLILGTLTVLIMLFGASTVTNLFEADSASHMMQQTATSSELDPRFILILIPLSFLAIGPAEEFLFRNIVQKRLYEDFTKASAVIISSLIFSAVHYPAYATGTLPEILTSLSSVLFLSIILGTAYAWTENLMVPAMIHGAYNAAVFGEWYLALTV